jgi:hypothetical protein
MKNQITGFPAETRCFLKLPKPGAAALLNAKNSYFIIELLSFLLYNIRNMPTGRRFHGFSVPKPDVLHSFYD